MSENINITIALQSSTLYQCLSILVDKKQQIQVEYQNNDILRDTIITLLYTCKQHDLFNVGADGKNLSSLLLFCAASNKIQHDFIRLLDLMKQSYHEHYNIVINTLNVKDFETHQQLINRLINHDDMSDDYNQEDVLSTLKSSKKVEQKPALDENKIKMLNLLDDDTFNNVLNTLGLDEAGMIKAKQIKQDIKDNKPINIPDIMEFIEDYKQTISQSDHPLVGNILNMFGITKDNTDDKQDQQNKEDDKQAQPAPFDLNNIMNMVTPFLNGLQNNQNRQQRRSVKTKRR
jgi:hypothetical protein